MAYHVHFCMAYHVHITCSIIPCLILMMIMTTDGIFDTFFTLLGLSLLMSYFYALPLSIPSVNIHNAVRSVCLRRREHFRRFIAYCASALRCHLLQISVYALSIRDVHVSDVRALIRRQQRRPVALFLLLPIILVLFRTVPPGSRNYADPPHEDDHSTYDEGVGMLVNVSFIKRIIIITTTTPRTISGSIRLPRHLLLRCSRRWFWLGFGTRSCRRQELNFLCSHITGRCVDRVIRVFGNGIFCSRFRALSRLERVALGSAVVVVGCSWAGMVPIYVDRLDIEVAQYPSQSHPNVLPPRTLAVDANRTQLMRASATVRHLCDDLT
mmetsp:Transcript_19620/g.34992  ORF Transcript_19620/g.34992 Transcript_19620/m.34992 type:complete len:325 (+) Transcript_19620:178-1152(+)